VSAVAWGGGDFGGGLMSRRTSVLGVALISQVVGMVVSVGLALLRAEGMPSATDVGWSVLAGIAGGIGITSLYRGLAVGRMGIVAPVTGVLAAIIPVAAGIVLEGVPDRLVTAGIVVAIVAVVLVSRVADEGGGRAGLGLAVLAGSTIGLFSVFIAQVSDGHVFGPLSIVRTAEAALIVGIIVVTRSDWRPAPKLVPGLIGIGVLDMLGNGAYILAVQSGALAVASVVSSLYPVTTVILATVFLRERVTRSHAVGIALAALAIVLIGVGSA
jgi:drug/metabolite transporter (DMT)-like permease